MSLVIYRLNNVFIPKTVIVEVMEESELSFVAKDGEKIGSGR